MAPDIGSIFHGVLYHIDRISDSEDRDLIQRLLERNGAKKSKSHHNATRIIVDPRHSSRFDNSKWSFATVTTEWVYSSVKCGVKRPSQYYSADPKLFFSSTVISTAGISDSGTALVRMAIVANGGEWLPTITADVTHLVVKSITHDCDPNGSTPIIVSIGWILNCLETKALAPTAPYELKPNTFLFQGKTNADSVSAARQFCEALSARDACDESRDNILLSQSGGPPPFVPFELFVKIFIQFRDDAISRPLPSLACLLAVSQVCGRWRSIAHCTSELWTHIPLNYHSKEHYSRLQRLFEAWAERSHPRTLTINVRSCYPGTKNPIIFLLLSYASRIRELSLNLPKAHFHRFLRAPAGSFSVLEKLRIHVIPKSDAVYDPSLGLSRYEYFCDEPEITGDGDGEVLLESMTTCLIDSPRLRSISIDSSGYTRLDSRMLPLAWGNLTNIDLEFVALSVLDVAYLLPQLNCVKRLNFATDDSMGPSMPVIPLVRLTHLVDLQWTGFDTFDDSIFDCLILPRLASLSMREGCLDTIYSLCERGSLALRELSLTFFSMTLPRLSSFLREMPSLVSLELYVSIDITDELLLFLTYDKGEKPVLPTLENLVIADREQQFTEPVMLRMLESRWRTTPLASGRITAQRAVANGADRKVRARVTELVEEGLKFQYNCN